MRVDREYIEDKFAKESELYQKIRAAKESVWKVRESAVELYNETRSDTAYNAYRTSQIAHELLETTKLLTMIQYEEITRKEKEGE